MIFVDASAIVAILVQEPERDRLLAALQLYPRRSTSALALYEAALAVRRLVPGGLTKARADVTEFVDRAQIEVTPIGLEEFDAALDAFERYGKGTGHPAGLNMGACFAYACATTLGAALLYKGDDFALTDVKAAV